MYCSIVIHINGPTYPHFKSANHWCSNYSSSTHFCLFVRLFVCLFVFFFFFNLLWIFILQLLVHSKEKYLFMDNSSSVKISVFASSVPRAVIRGIMVSLIPIRIRLRENDVSFFLKINLEEEVGMTHTGDDFSVIFQVLLILIC